MRTYEKIVAWDSYSHFIGMLVAAVATMEFAGCSYVGPSSADFSPYIMYPMVPKHSCGKSQFVHMYCEASINADMIMGLNYGI